MKKALLSLVLLAVGAAAATWFVPELSAWCARTLPLPDAAKRILEERSRRAVPAAADGGEKPADAKPGAGENAAPASGGGAEPEVKEPSEAKVEETSGRKTKAKKTAAAAEGGGDGDDDDLPPALRGVSLAPLAKAAWCVTKQNTPVYDAKDGSAVGNVAGGRFFIVTKVVKEGREVSFEGNFTPKKIPGHEAVRISSEFVYGLTGAPEALSKPQRRALRDYYELLGKAEEYKAAKLKEAGSKSPYFQKAADATSKFLDKANQYKRLKAQGKFSADQEREAHYKLQQLKNAAEELNNQHRKWKAEHPETAVEPEKDAVYRELVSKSEALRGVIPGLAL